jgi:hypothetical protein
VTDLSRSAADRPGAGAAAARAPRAASLPFFPVSITKLVLVSFFTLGVYEAYWIYRNWQHIRDREGLRISPFWRAFVPFFYCYPIFRRVRDFTSDAADRALPAGPLALGWIVTSPLAWLPDPYGWLCFVASILCLVPVQHAANRINRGEQPDHDPNSRFTIANLLGMLLGGALIALAYSGVLPLPTAIG